ncbi:hypothetical protein E2C01_066921 [Portunus trituberculatus]|uniref:Uncharacterized protein n=1 Tax=Portunus trituberculatus TaxID=210409 RepID=A0A5B7HS87_PORTR|nr:hypothetical protein [Portunus trituberculatus]
MSLCSLAFFLRQCPRVLVSSCPVVLVSSVSHPVLPPLHRHVCVEGLYIAGSETSNVTLSIVYLRSFLSSSGDEGVVGSPALVTA